jgi:aminoglycoside phosphotransferase
MVFGHGDMHGHNMAVAEDASGLRLVGAFDLGCTGIMDVHEDLFRLSLVSEALLDRVIAGYHDLAGQTRSLDRGRLATYYCAFLFYLMDGTSGAGLQHLKRLLRTHIAYSAT